MRSDPITAGAIGAPLVMASSGQAGAYQEDEYPDTPEQDAVARASELLARFHIARSARQTSDDESFIMGSFYADIARCVTIFFSSRHRPVE